jgi:hypothetical protein
MSDAVHIEAGAKPWLPSPETTSVVVLHRFTIPLVGVIDQHGVQYLYWCVVGHAAPESAWAYASVNADGVERLKAADGDSFDDVLREVVDQNACTFAMASDERGVIASVMLLPPAKFDDVHQRGMTEMAEKFRETFAEYQILRERFPLLQSAVNFDLVPTPALPAHQAM